MRITVNGKEKDLLKNQTLKELIYEVASRPERTIAELNGEIVQIPQWPNITLKTGDKLELVSFVGGG